MTRSKRLKFADVRKVPPGLVRTAAVAAWFQGLFGGEYDTPVLVGGAAVELYTRGAFTTADLDFVGQVPNVVAEELERGGFQKDGRHWIHEEAQIFLELAAPRLDKGQETARIEVSHYSVLALAPEDVLVDRLADWELWKSEIDAVSAFLIWTRDGQELNKARIRSLARSRSALGALTRLDDFVKGLGEREPSPEELKEWALKS